MTAIVTDAHYRMSLALIRDLADSGVRVIACEYDDMRDFIRAVFLSVRLFLGKCKAGRDFFSCVKG